MIKKFAQIEPEPPWTLFAALLIAMAMFIALYVGTALSQVILPDSEPALVLLAGWSIGMVLTAIAVRNFHLRTSADVEALRIGDTATNLPIIFVFSLGVAATFDLMSWLISGDKALVTAELFNFDTTIAVSGWMIAVVFMVLLQPVAEELVFRGMLFPVLRFSTGSWTGWVICAAFYGAFHLAAYLPEGTSQRVFFWYGFILPFLIGLVIGGVRGVTGSTRAAIMAHAAFGVFAVFKVWIMTAG